MGDSNRDARINRRRFLQVVGFIAGGAVLTPLLGQARFFDLRAGRRGRIYQGTPDGKLLASADGQEWALLSDFGPHLAVNRVEASRDGWLRSTLAMGEHSFVLKSRDEQTWYTDGYVAPGQA